MGKLQHQTLGHLRQEVSWFESLLGHPSSSESVEDVRTVRLIAVPGYRNRVWCGQPIKKTSAPAAIRLFSTYVTPPQSGHVTGHVAQSS